MDETPVVGKQGHRSPKEHEWIEEQVGFRSVSVNTELNRR